MSGLSISCVLVDDEKKACSVLEKKLKEFENVRITGIYNDYYSALEGLSNDQPDLLFLDIDLGGFSGIDLAKSLINKGLSTSIVYVTAHDSFTIEAIRQDAFDYLLKPVSTSDLQNLLTRYMEKSSADSQMIKLGGKVRFNTLSGFFIIPLDEIMYVKADGNYCELNLIDGKSKLVTSNLATVEKRPHPNRIFSALVDR